MPGTCGDPLAVRDFRGSRASAIGAWALLDLGIVEANAVAVDTSDQIFVGGAVTVNTGFFRSPVIIKVDATGKTSTFDFGGEGGRVLAIAVDSCGSVLAGLVRQQSPDPTSPIDAVVQKLAL